MPSRVERVSDRVVLYRCDKTAVWLARAVQHHKHFAPELAIASVLQDASPQLHLHLQAGRPGSSATRASLRLDDHIPLHCTSNFSRSHTVSEAYNKNG